MKIALQKLMMLVLIFSCTTVSFSQSKREKKANQDYRTYAFVDAREVYKKLVENGEKSAHIYRKIAGTHYWNSEYKDAAQWYVRLLSEFESDATMIDYFRASQALKSRNTPGDSIKSVQYFEAYVNKGGNPRPATQKRDYIVELEMLDVINKSNFSDFGPAFYGDKLVYASAANQTEGVRLHSWNEQPYLDLYVAELDEDGRPTFQAPFSEKLNTSFHESSAVFTKDGNTVYFTRNNFVDGKKRKGKKKTIRLKLFKSTKSGSNWGDVVDLKKAPGETKASTGLNNDNWSIAHPALSTDEKYIYFSSDMPTDMSFVGDKTVLEPDEVMSDLWMAEILPDNKFGDVKKLDLINTPNRESFPFVSKANKLYFSSDGRDGKGGYDVYVVDLDSVSGMPKGEVRNLGEPINGPGDDFGFIIDEEKKMGYLSSNRANPTAGSKGDDIYMHKECEITIIGTATDKNTGVPLEGATVTLKDENGDTVGEPFITGPDGNYRFENVVYCSREYRLQVEKKDCVTDETIINTPDKTEVIRADVALSCNICDPCDIGCKFNIGRIHFEFDMYNIDDDITLVKRNYDGTYVETSNRGELGILLAALQTNDKLVISIESHTDSRGSHEYNEWLSTQRAIATRNWFMAKGISGDRLCAQAFGETELVTPCPDGVKCTEEEHDFNRRSEYKIITDPEGNQCDLSAQRKPCILETEHTSWANWKRRR